MKNGATRILTLGADNLERELARNELPLFVEFRAEWCAPCRAMRTTFETFAERYAGRARVGHIDVDEESDLVEQHDISSIPTLIVFQDGNAVQRIIGATDLETLKSSLERLEAAS